MKPTRTETRGTWLLAAICALALAAAILANKCGGPEPLPAATPLPEPSEQSEPSDKSDRSDLEPQSSQNSQNSPNSHSSRKTKPAKKPRGPKPQAPDTPSPLDRPV